MTRTTRWYSTGSARLTAGYLLAGSLMTTLIGCGAIDPAAPSADIDPAEQPILGGTPVPAGVRKEVGLVSTAVGSCTATLFDNRHFLTASHCINYVGMQRGGTLSLEGAANLGVDRIFSLGTRQLGQHDLAVGQLVNPVAASVATPATIGTAAPSFSTTITEVGYGCTNRSSGVGFGTKRYLTFTRNSNDDVGCPGDSGGPSFLGGLNDNGALVLVTSGWTAGLFNDSDIYADPGLHRSEIFALTDSLSRDGICYRTHAADIGWTPAVCNGGIAGTVGQNRTLYGIQMWSNRPGVSVCYNAYLSNVGWQGEKCDSDTAGILGQADKGIQAVKIRLASRSRGEVLTITPNVGGLGWQPAVGENTPAGIPGSGRRLESFTVTMNP